MTKYIVVEKEYGYSIAEARFNSGLTFKVIAETDYREHADTIVKALNEKEASL